MNAREMLLAEFHRLAEVPGAVPRLRRFVLDLAVRGKLVEQDSGEGKGTDELQTMPGSRAASVEPPWTPPPGWTWTTLAAFMSEAGGTVDASAAPSTTYCLWSVPAFASGKPEIVRGSQLGSAKRAIARGAVLLSKINPHLNRVWITDGYSEYPHIASSEWIALTSQGVERKLLRHFIMSPWFLQNFCAQRSGIGGSLTRVRPTAAAKLLLPIPPLAEQRRIVAKVDELMALCDRLEAAQQATAEQRDQLSALALHGLSDGNGDGERRERGRFYLYLMPRLSTGPAHLQGLRHATLRLAVEGGLVAQDPADEPATAALEAGDRARAAVAARDRRASAQSQAPLAEELRWKVPGSWEWRPLADLVLFIDYRGKTPRKTRSGIRLITAKNVRRACINARPEEFIDEREYESWMSRGLPQDGDVLFTTEAPMGNAAVLRVTERVALAQRVICFRGYGAVDPAFLVLQLLSPPFQAILSVTATGLTAKGIKAAKLKRLPIAVPPRTEQLRIVARVAELLDTCDRLEEHAATCRGKGSALFEAVLQRALADAF